MSHLQVTDENTLPASLIALPAADVATLKAEPASDVPWPMPEPMTDVNELTALPMSMAKNKMSSSNTVCWRLTLTLLMSQVHSDGDRKE